MGLKAIAQLLRSAPKVLSSVELKTCRDFFREGFFSNIQEARLHPLGFFYIKQDLCDSETLRFHMWPAGISIPQSQIDSDIHDHIFELNSAILAGEMRHETFSFSPTEEGNFNIATIEYLGNISAMHRDSTRGNLTVTEDVTFCTGQMYRLPPYTIHRAQPASLPMATLVLAVTRPPTKAPRIVIDHLTPEPAPFDRRLLNDGEKSLARKMLQDMWP